MRSSAPGRTTSHARAAQSSERIAVKPASVSAHTSSLSRRGIGARATIATAASASATKIGELLSVTGCHSLMKRRKSPFADRLAQVGRQVRERRGSRRTRHRHPAARMSARVREGLVGSNRQDAA